MRSLVIKVGADEASAQQGSLAKYALVMQLRYKSVEQKTLSSP